LIVLADSSKLSPRGSLVVCPLARIATVITDAAASAEQIAMLEEAGIAVIVAERLQLQSAA
jgi:DeoR family transcriptional regulator, ulaG and ulaABCDEF operon transcriptional repressor